MTTITLAPIQGHIYLLSKYCTCSESDIFALNHKDGCGYRQWYDKWEKEYLRAYPWEKEHDGRKTP